MGARVISSLLNFFMNQKLVFKTNVNTGKVFTPDESAHKTYASYVDLYEQAANQMKDLYAKLNKL